MNLPIQICDNNRDGLTIDDANHLSNLQKIAEKPIGQLSLEDHPNLLIFPQNLEEYGDKIGQQYVFEIREDKLLTGNIMGFIGYRHTKVRIHFGTHRRDNAGKQTEQAQAWVLATLDRGLSPTVQSWATTADRQPPSLSVSPPGP